MARDVTLEDVEAATEAARQAKSEFRKAKGSEAKHDAAEAAKADLAETRRRYREQEIAAGRRSGTVGGDAARSEG